MRVALLASPRSGNNWFRRILARSLAFPEHASHTLEEFPAELDQDAILNIHVACNDVSRRYFDSLGCIRIALARHPLDVLVSVLPFACQVPGVHRWLDGACNIPKNVDELTPVDDPYVEWMCSAGAKALLSVSLSWWHDAQTRLRIKYEDLVDAPEKETARIIRGLGLVPATPIADAVNLYSLAWFREHTRNAWLGSVGTYTRFLTPDVARRVADCHRENMEVLGYVAVADACPEADTARRNFAAASPRPHPRVA